MEASKEDEVVAYACMERSGEMVTMRYGWSSVGRIHVAGFRFELLDCVTKKGVPETIRTMTYPSGTKARSASGIATFTFPRERQLEPHVYGTGEYGRYKDGYVLEGSVGHFDTYEDPKFIADGVCR